MMRLLTIELNIFIITILLFMFLLPVFLIKHNTKLSKFLCLSIYIISLIFGLFTQARVINNTIYFDLVFDTLWGNALLNTAYFNSFNILMNLLLLFPLGTFFPLFARKKSNFLLKIGIRGLITSSAIETLQFILPINRVPEILDVITNTISAILGYLYFLFISMIIRGETNDKLSKQKNNINN